MGNTLRQRIAGYLKQKLSSNVFLRLQLIVFGFIQRPGKRVAYYRLAGPVNSKLKVSVIMPTYNRGRLLQKAIDSYFKQNYKNSELIVLNNGSVDNTKEILSQYHGRILVIEREKNNINDALNVLWSASSGDLICILFDDDEFFDEQSLSLRVNEFNNHGSVEVVYGGVMLRDFSGKDRALAPGEEPDLQKLLKKEYINLTSMMWKRCLKDKFMFDEDFEFNSDTLFKIRCLKECSVSAIKEPVMAYRVHEDQETRRMYAEGKYEIEKKLIKKKLSLLYGDLFV